MYRKKSGFFWPKFGAGKDHITWWMRAADLCSLGSAQSKHINIWPLAPVGRPPPTQAANGQNCLCLCAFSFPDLLGTRLRERTWGDERQSAVSCGFLRFSAVSCENQRFSAKICASQMLCFLRKGENLQESAKICENLRLGSVGPLRFVPLCAPWSSVSTPTQLSTK